MPSPAITFDREDFSHLDALQDRLVNEIARGAHPVTIRGIEREIAEEKRFLGLDKIEAMSNDELVAELSGI